MAALKLMIEVEQALTGSTRLKRILFDCCWLVSSVIVIICPDECGSTRVWSNVIALPLSIHDCICPVHTCAREVMFTQPPTTISLLILLDSCKLHHKYPLRSHLTLY